jgi:hypothetical protein
MIEAIPPTPVPKPPAPKPAVTPKPAAPAPTTTNHPAPAPSPAPAKPKTSTKPKTASPAPSPQQTTPTPTTAIPEEDTFTETADATKDEAEDSKVNVFSDRISTIYSDDDVVTVVFPEGTFEEDAYCSVNIDSIDNTPVNAENTIGPYSIDCLDSENNQLANPNKPIKVSLDVALEKEYVAYTYGSEWSQVQSKKITIYLNLSLLIFDL